MPDIHPRIRILSSTVDHGKLIYRAEFDLSDGTTHAQAEPIILCPLQHGKDGAHHQEIKAIHPKGHPTPHVEERLAARRRAASLLAAGDHEGALRTDALSALAELEGRIAARTTPIT